MRSDTFKPLKMSVRMTFEIEWHKLINMTQRTKLFEKIKNGPNNVTFAQIERLLLREGFSLDRIAESHHIFTRGDVTFAIPKHGKQVKAVYVERVIEILEGES